MRGFSDYRQPFLAADRIYRGAKRGTLELSAGNRNLVITVESGDADTMREILERFCKPGSRYWRELRENPDPGLLALLDRLNRLGWVREADSSGRDQRANEEGDTRELVERAVSWLLEASSCICAIGGQH